MTSTGSDQDTKSMTHRLSDSSIRSINLRIVRDDCYNCYKCYKCPPKVWPRDGRDAEGHPFACHRL